MTSGRNILFPRSAVDPAVVGRRVMDARKARGWSQRRLAEVVGCSRKTVNRLEAGEHRPCAGLVRNLEVVLGFVRLVPGWQDHPSLDEPSFGPRCRLARCMAGVTQRVAAQAAGISTSTLSRFERELGDTPMIVSPDTETIANEGLATVLGFADAADLADYCMSSQPGRWLPEHFGPV